MLFLSIAIAVIIAYLSIIVHEGGHLIFGLFSGYRFSSFRIGSFMWIKQEDKIHLRRHSIAGTGGQCLMTPPDEIESKMPVVLYNLGGVIVNIVFAVILFSISFLFPDFPMIAFGIRFGALISLSMALTNGIPLNIGGIANDGMNALHLSKNPDAAAAFRNQLLMNAAQSEGRRISEMPDEWFTLPEGADMQNVHCASVAVFSASRPLDRGDTVGAEDEISKLLHSGYNIIGLHRNLLTCDLIYCRLINGTLPTSSLLTPELKKFMKAMAKYPSIIRTEYAVALLVDKDPEQAKNIKANFEKHSVKFPYQQEISSERELMERALKKYENER